MDKKRRIRIGWILLAVLVLVGVYRIATRYYHDDLTNERLCKKFEEVLTDYGWECRPEICGLQTEEEWVWFAFGSWAEDLHGYEIIPEYGYNPTMVALLRGYEQMEGAVKWLPYPRYIVQAKMVLENLGGGSYLVAYAMGIFNRAMEFEYGTILYNFKSYLVADFPLDIKPDDLRAGIDSLRGCAKQKP